MGRNLLNVKRRKLLKIKKNLEPKWPSTLGKRDGDIIVGPYLVGRCMDHHNTIYCLIKKS